MGFQDIIARLLFWTLILQCFACNYGKKCNGLCGAGSNLELPYPFGFSEGCGIKLNCDNGVVKIGEFQVKNLTVDSILVKVPASCSRGIEDILPLDGKNFKISPRNVLLLENCSHPLPDCKVFKSFIGSPRCRFSNESMSCYSEDSKDMSFLNIDRLKQSKCGSVHSSITLDDSVDNGAIPSSAMSLHLQTVELVWWLDGNCKCHPNGKCSPVKLPKGGSGFRCSCKDGFVGDGFADGDGCKKASSCNASKYMSGKCGGTRVGILIVGVVLGVCLTSLLLLACNCTRKRSASLKKRVSAKRLSEAAGCSSVRLYPYKELERATNGFSDEMRLGTGAYGTVYAGKLYNHELVAIKRLKPQDADGVENVMNEIKLLSSVSHPNLVRLLGCCLENDEQILVYEYMPNGTLSHHLHGKQRSGLPWLIRLNIATETAHAIAHLHSSMNPPIYHRDIKSTNILLDFSYKCKIADFGLSRFAMTDDSHISTAPQGTPGYLDPQYHQNYHLSDKSDVYSFGVVLLEIITAKKVVDFARPNSEINLAALAIDRIGKGRVDEIIDPCLEPNRDAWTLSSIHRVAELAFRCLAFHKDMRPSMTEVADELDQMRVGSWEPVEGNICMTTSSSCTSRHNCSERSFCSSLNNKKVIKESSPVSVRDPWASDENSPSADKLLGSGAGQQ
ncbi:unnamed protein product [Cuscuta epithymum]|nr:unnamed protein product [Cuscuta epithymum]